MRVRNAFWVLLGTGVFVGCMFLANKFTTTGYSFLWAAAVTLFLWVSWRFWSGVDAAVLARTNSLVSHRNPDRRVRCVGPARSIACVLTIGPIEDRLFEPRSFFAMGAASSHWRRAAVQLLGGVSIAVGLVLAGRVFRPGVVAAYFVGLVALGGAIVAGGVVFPTYLRVLPGRIDIMECGFLGLRIISVRRISLRSDVVTVDVSRHVIQVGAGKKARQIAFGAIVDRWAFAHAVLMAAVSTHTPPPLPDDALAG